MRVIGRNTQIYRTRTTNLPLRIFRKMQTAVVAANIFVVFRAAAARVDGEVNATSLLQQKQFGNEAGHNPERTTATLALKVGNWNDLRNDPGFHLC